MIQPKDGGPAFPGVTEQISIGGPEGGYFKTYPANGMSLRDWFAGMALQGWLAQFAHPDYKAESNTNCDLVAGIAYRLADAMLKEREK